MDSKIKPIPAFYCCYLLRSTVRHGSLYVGSSPHPSRRLAQHNGKSKGGAVRTSRLSLRPWEMACVVAGFPSNIAALQFEWAWQNAHLTRHILPEERISFPVSKIKINAKTGKTRKKPGRPRTSMVERLSNLHLLLRTRYFSQWPLELRFFSEDVYRSWNSWCARVDTQVRPEIKVLLDLVQQQPQDQQQPNVEETKEEEEFSSAQRPPPSTSTVSKTKKRKVATAANLIGKGGIQGVDPTYARYQEVFEKSRFILPDENDHHGCDVCKNSLDLNNDLFAICTSSSCTSLSHVTCLSEHFLRDGRQTNAASSSSVTMPVAGSCPRCHSELLWSDVMRAVSLRIRGEKEVKKLLKKKRGSKAVTAAEIMEDESEDEDNDEDDEDANDVIDEELNEENDDDKVSVSSFGSIASTHNDMRSPSKLAAISSRLEIVIEDSEDER